jgi:hypothetical protein
MNLILEEAVFAASSGVIQHAYNTSQKKGKKKEKGLIYVLGETKTNGVEPEACDVPEPD